MTSGEPAVAAAVALSAVPAGAGDERPMTDQLATAVRRSVQGTALPIQRDLGDNAFSLAISNDGKVTLDDLHPADWAGSPIYPANQHSDLSWELTLEPGATQTLTYEVSLYE